MSEEKNIEEQSNDDLPQPSETDMVIEPSINNEQPSTENMEVHHHTHPGHHKKKWTDYFWEFLMLFLAVFCGFFAEYQLEHKIERDRAKELAKSFYQELKNDSVTAALKFKNRIRQEESLGYLTKYFKDSSLENVSKSFAINYEYGIDFRSPSIFEPRKIILEQLKNSGSLRYFKNDSLQALIGSLTVAITNIYDRQDLESRVRFEYIDPLIMQIYDYDFDTKLLEQDDNIFQAIAAYEQGDVNIPFHIDQPGKIDRLKVVKILNFFRTNTLSST